MSTDEMLVTVGFSLLIPGVTLVGILVWNAVVMPSMLRRPVAVLLWLQGVIYSTQMVSLLLLRLSEPSAVVAWIKAVAVLLQVMTVLVIIMRVYQLKAARLIQVLVLALMASLFGGGK